MGRGADVNGRPFVVGELHLLILCERTGALHIGVGSDKTHIEPNETALDLTRRQPRDFDFCCNGANFGREPPFLPRALSYMKIFGTCR